MGGAVAVGKGGLAKTSLAIANRLDAMLQIFIL
jgi:MinD superfamily P-loop ATPase